MVHVIFERYIAGGRNDILCECETWEEARGFYSNGFKVSHSKIE